MRFLSRRSGSIRLDYVGRSRLRLTLVLRTFKTCGENVLKLQKVLSESSDYEVGAM